MPASCSASADWSRRCGPCTCLTSTMRSAALRFLPELVRGRFIPGAPTPRFALRSIVYVLDEAADEFSSARVFVFSSDGSGTKRACRRPVNRRRIRVTQALDQTMTRHPWRNVRRLRQAVDCYITTRERRRDVLDERVLELHLEALDGLAVTVGASSRVWPSEWSCRTRRSGPVGATPGQPACGC